MVEIDPASVYAGVSSGVPLIGVHGEGGIVAEYRRLR
jgi:hypothetical protein